MLEIDEQEIKKRLSKELSHNVFEHSLRVMETSEKLGLKEGIDRDKARIAGLLHDCARKIPVEKMVSKAEEFGIKVGDFERKEPYLLHAPLGSKIAEKEYQVTEPDILKAIASHTLGDIDMSSLDKLIYLADMIEPGRDFNEVERIRKLAEKSLDEAFKKAYAHTVEYVVGKGKELHPITVEIWRSLVKGSDG